MSDEKASNHCLFCALPSFKNEPNSILPDNPPLHPTFMKEENSIILTDQLKVIFILQNILGLENDKLCQFLVEETLPPQLWLKVCDSCEEAVIRFYTISKEISKLQQEQLRIAKELKARIHTTRESHLEENESVWRDVREHVLKEFPVDPDPSSSPDYLVNAADVDGPLITGDLPNEEDDLIDEVYHLDVKYNHSNHEEDHHQPPTQQKKKGSGNQRGGELRYALEGLPVSEHPRYFLFSKKKYTVYTCLECSCNISSLRVFKPHMELHRPGSNAVICETCGWFLDPDKVIYHYAHHHPNRKNGVKVPLKASRARRYLKCKDCGALFSRKGKMGEHKALHEEGGGVVCPIPTCGWLCKVLTTHNTYWHPPEKEKALVITERLAVTRIVTE